MLLKTTYYGNITVERYHWGLLLSGNGESFKYIDYTLKEALSLFRQYIKEQSDENSL